MGVPSTVTSISHGEGLCEWRRREVSQGTWRGGESGALFQPLPWGEKSSFNNTNTLKAVLCCLWEWSHQLWTQPTCKLPKTNWKTVKEWILTLVSKNSAPDESSRQSWLRTIAIVSPAYREAFFFFSFLRLLHTLALIPGLPGHPLTLGFPHDMLRGREQAAWSPDASVLVDFAN